MLIIIIFKYLTYNWPEVACCLVCHSPSFFCFSFLIFSMLEVLICLSSTYSHFYFSCLQAHLKNYLGLHKLNFLHVFFDYESPTLHCNEIDIKQWISLFVIRMNIWIDLATQTTKLDIYQVFTNSYIRTVFKLSST